MAIVLSELGGKLFADVDGRKYLLGAGKKNVETPASVKDMDAIFQHIEKEGAALSDDVKTLLKEDAVLDDIVAHGGVAGKKDAIKAGLTFAFKGATEAEKMAELVSSPSARKYFTAEALEKAGIKDVKALDGYLAARTELTKILKDGGDNAAKLEKIFIDNHKAPAEVRAALAAVKVENVTTTDLASIATKVETAIAADAKTLEGLLSRTQKLNDDLAKKQIEVEKAKANGITGDKLKEIEKAGSEALDTERKAINEGIEKLKKDNPRYAAAEEIVKKDETLAKVLKEDKAFGGVAAKGANWIKGGKWYSFIHDAESAGPEIAKIGKFRWGKAAIIGIPVGAALTYFLAGTGNKGPGERAEAVSKGRDGQAVGVGV